MTKNSHVPESIGHEINKMLARCGCHSRNEDEFELHSDSGDLLPGEHVGIYWMGEKVGSFSYSVSTDGRDIFFVGRELCPVLPTDPDVRGAWFVDGPLENEAEDEIDLIDGLPPDRIIFEDLTYYLVYEPDGRNPQEIGRRFVYSLKPASTLR